MQSPVRNIQQKPLLNPQPPQGQEARVDAVFDAIQQYIGFVPDALRLYSFSPPLLETYVGNISYFNSGERLSPALMAMIRYLVSSEAKCNFCIDMNEGILSKMGVDLGAVRASRSNLDKAPLPDKEKVLLNLAVKAVQQQDSIGEAEIQEARKHGWSERDIFDVVVQAANMRSLNYVLRTFKVEAQGAFAA